MYAGRNRKSAIRKRLPVIQDASTTHGDRGQQNADGDLACGGGVPTHHVNPINFALISGGSASRRHLGPHKASELAGDGRCDHALAVLGC